MDPADVGDTTNRHWDIADAAQYAKLLVDYTHSLGLAAAQKNTTDFFDYSAELGAYPYHPRLVRSALQRGRARALTRLVWPVAVG